MYGDLAYGALHHEYCIAVYREENPGPSRGSSQRVLFRSAVPQSHLEPSAGLAPSARTLSKCLGRVATHRVRIRFIQYLRVFFRHFKKLRGESHYPIRVAFLYLASVVPLNVIFARRRSDAEDSPPVRPRLCGHPPMRFSACSLRLALCCPSPPLRFALFSFRLAQTLCEKLSLRLQFRLFLGSTQFSFSQLRVP